MGGWVGTARAGGTPRDFPLVTFHTEIENQNKKSNSQEHVLVANPCFNLFPASVFKDGITIKEKTATLQRKEEKRLKISNIPSPLLVPA